ncbi:ORF MSV242 putative inhibitor of apoptosis protein (IAP), similar to Autographa californica NPV GB:D36828 [Melanoplus sanguinipes entomopoxvirus]|uniref:ORF MSV242 putative inhibitor of apoptosis protein (IAP), similar to Autographa californica NPV GB:D36828 n=1 Tax=Melanoplus sanguinipes entomopoxvirus TaxID=83191 RepID=Q9YVK0_MSEPV|nr:ORF MSV242 putative inhibitor of apoptosis protein (IAP), similar to Autographa californica NPV GB:D36828 [Melanoplus sanguinipes entomopoxvirus]AAC97721.1 ORF MSV242 putative inhibitor of apoptosis protein (IAP), similar to Autographa californica NPV GB:D36828 [Melanoplus sanguinipes entomopoxvirus 'O']
MDGFNQQMPIDEMVEKTYDKWDNSIEIYRMMNAGFTCKGPSIVECMECRKVLTDWKKGDNPFFEHIYYSKDCPLINLILLRLLSIQILGIETKLKDLGLIIPIWKTCNDELRVMDVVDDGSTFKNVKNDDFDLYKNHNLKKKSKISYYCPTCKVDIQLLEDEINSDHYIFKKHIRFSENSCDFMKLKLGSDICDKIYNVDLKLKSSAEELKKLFTQYENENKNENKNLKCKICNNNNRNIIAFPCLHIYACISCYKKNKKCNSCNEDILQYARVIINENELCSTCNSEKCDMLFLPCGHISSCKNCFYKGKMKCNKCDKDVMGTSDITL